MSETILRVERLVKKYPSGNETLTILNDVSFSADTGVSIAVSGKSGSGKSTLLNIIGGLDTCDGGSVIVGGDAISGFSEKQLTFYRRKRVGFIFQFHHLLKDFTALENAMLPGFIAGMTKHDALEKAALLLEEVQLTDRAHHYPSELSGGERQRVAVARSLINDPDIILADEPTGNLDKQSGENVAAILYRSAEKWGKTLIVVTHDAAIAARAQKQYVLAGGVIANSAADNAGIAEAGNV